MVQSFPNLWERRQKHYHLSLPQIKKKHRDSSVMPPHAIRPTMVLWQVGDLSFKRLYNVKNSYILCGTNSGSSPKFTPLCEILNCNISSCFDNFFFFLPQLLIFVFLLCLLVLPSCFAFLFCLLVLSSCFDFLIIFLLRFSALPSCFVFFFCLPAWNMDVWFSFLFCILA